MPSPAAETFSNGALRARTLYATAADMRLRPMAHFNGQSFFHAGLAAIVAAWDAYLNEVVEDFYRAIANPTDIAYHSIFEVAQESTSQASRRFNTPNWDNARNFLVATTGYDPINDWIWPRRQMTVQDVKERLDQILKVRHSFAHGFNMPSYPWNTTFNGRVRLTLKTMRDSESFFVYLVGRTDRGLEHHIRQRYGSVTAWYTS